MSDLKNTNTAAAIRREIIASDYRVLHFAAHGIHSDTRTDRIGVVIGYDKNDETELFGPHHVGAIRNKPSLVFINCCEAGKVENWHAHKLSASLAAEFIKAGVHCVIGAGWAVEDDAARLFAEEIYGCLLSGGSFGEAVRKARQAVYRNYPHTNTWAAFQCYGDPGYVLARKSNSSYSPLSERFFHISELIHELKNLRQDLNGGKATDIYKAHVVQQALDIYKEIKGRADANEKESWEKRGDVLTHLALVFCEAGDTVKGDKFIERATSANLTEVSLKNVLELINFQARRAEAKFEEARRDRKGKTISAEERQYKKELESVLHKLEHYVELHKDSHTLEIAATGYKLLAMSSTNKRERLSCLKKMILLYEESALQKNNNADYPGTNALVGYALLADLENESNDK